MQRIYHHMSIASLIAVVIGFITPAPTVYSADSPGAAQRWVVWPDTPLVHAPCN